MCLFRVSRFLLESAGGWPFLSACGTVASSLFGVAAAFPLGSVVDVSLRRSLFGSVVVLGEGIRGPLSFWRAQWAQSSAADQASLTFLALLFRARFSRFLSQFAVERARERVHPPNILARGGHWRSARHLWAAQDEEISLETGIPDWNEAMKAWFLGRRENN